MGLIKNSDPAIDPTHPDSTLPLRQSGDAFLRLVRKYGLKRGVRLFGVFQAAMSDDPEVKAAFAEPDRSRSLVYTDLQMLKAVNLVPDELYPSEMFDWLNAYWKAGFDIGKISAESLYKFRGERRNQRKDAIT